MDMRKNGSVVAALLSAVLGVMLIVMKGEVISIVLTVIGCALIIAAITDFFRGFTTAGVIKAVIGVSVLVFGWLFINLALYILAAVIIIAGLMQIVRIHRIGQVFLTDAERILAYIKPVLTVLAGAVLLFNQGGVIDWIFIFTGILLIAEGILELLGVIRN